VVSILLSGLSIQAGTPPAAREFRYIDPMRIFDIYTEKASHHSNISYGLTLGKLERVFADETSGALPDILVELRNIMQRPNSAPNIFPRLYHSSYFRGLEATFANAPEVLHKYMALSRTIGGDGTPQVTLIENPLGLVFQVLSRLDEVLTQVDYASFSKNASHNILNDRDFKRYQGKLRAKLPKFSPSDLFPGEAYAFYAFFGSPDPAFVVSEILFTGDFSYRKLDMAISSYEGGNPTSWKKRLSFLDGLPRPEPAPRNQLLDVKIHGFTVQEALVEDHYGTSAATLEKQLSFWNDIRNSSYSAQSRVPVISIDHIENHLNTHISELPKKIRAGHNYLPLIKFLQKARTILPCERALSAG